MLAKELSRLGNKTPTQGSPEHLSGCFTLEIARVDGNTGNSTHNLFVYCGNDPVNYSDPCGYAITIGIVLTIIGIAIAASALAYNAGTWADERLYWRGLRNKKYQKYKSTIRTLVLGVGKYFGGLFMTGFENKFYSMTRQYC